MLSEGILKMGVSQLAMTHFACPYDALRVSSNDARNISGSQN